jgi:hypothetical protein
VPGGDPPACEQLPIPPPVCDYAGWQACVNKTLDWCPTAGVTPEQCKEMIHNLCGEAPPCGPAPLPAPQQTQ